MSINYLLQKVCTNGIKRFQEEVFVQIILLIIEKIIVLAKYLYYANIIIKKISYKTF